MDAKKRREVEKERPEIPRADEHPGARLRFHRGRRWRDIHSTMASSRARRCSGRPLRERS